MKKHLKKHSLHLIHVLLIILSTMELSRLYQAHKSDDHLLLKANYEKLIAEHKALKDNNCLALSSLNETL